MEDRDQLIDRAEKRATWACHALAAASQDMCELSDMAGELQVASEGVGGLVRNIAQFKIVKAQTRRGAWGC